ncbi:MAG TPA: type II toxin-antitoxin system HicA family toxin [Rhizomicrobium sp.]|jgi:predicted RNA binding protein YcfA (HicA-like mRNA interferase family)|nr:type II toxin-antitoxin system HicA family toxin [Rhizomicrobium sp.]
MLTSVSQAPIQAYNKMANAETSRSKVVSRLLREGWELARHGGAHDVFRHPAKDVIVLPRHRTLSPGVARSIAKTAGWN